LNSLCSRVTVVVIVVLMSVTFFGCHGSFSDVPVDCNDVSQITGGAEPFFELWDEEYVITSVNVAMDGTVLLFNRKGQAAKHPDNRKGFDTYFKRSEDGGATWSDSQFIGKYIELDWKALGIGPYDGNGWGRDKHHAYAHLGTSVVDETTGEIMFFMTSLYPAPYMYKSQDNGKTWKLEKIEFEKDSRGFLPTPNAACDPGITIKHGPHKGRLLVPSRVMPNYNKHEEAKGYTNAVYSDDHGKTWFSSEPFPIDGTGESGLVELSDGTIYFNSRTHTRKGNRWVAYSDDSGETWRDCHEDDELFDGPPDMYGCKAGLLRLDRDDCDIFLFSAPDPSLPEKQNRANVNVWVSLDGGETWPYNRLIKEGPGNYSWLAQGRKGTPSEGFIYVRTIEGGMARFNMAWLLQLADKKAGKPLFAESSGSNDNRASIGPDSDEFVLPPRHDYRMKQRPPFVKSVKNAKLFKFSDDRLKRLETGYKLIDTKAKGHVLPHKISMPGNEMKISCDVSLGSITILLLDPAGKLIKTSKPITGGFKVREPVQWPDGFKLDKYLATPVTVKFELEGEAKLYAIRFDELFWE
jgi:sialidase-1